MKILLHKTCRYIAYWHKDMQCVNKKKEMQNTSLPKELNIFSPLKGQSQELQTNTIAPIL